MQIPFSSHDPVIVPIMTAVPFFCVLFRTVTLRPGLLVQLPALRYFLNQWKVYETYLFRQGVYPMQQAQPIPTPRNPEKRQKEEKFLDKATGLVTLLASSMSLGELESTKHLATYAKERVKFVMVENPSERGISEAAAAEMRGHTLVLNNTYLRKHIQSVKTFLDENPQHYPRGINTEEAENGFVVLVAARALLPAMAHEYQHGFILSRLENAKCDQLALMMQNETSSHLVQAATFVELVKQGGAAAEFVVRSQSGKDTLKMVEAIAQHKDERDTFGTALEKDYFSKIPGYADFPNLNTDKWYQLKQWAQKNILSAQRFIDALPKEEKIRRQDALDAIKKFNAYIDAASNPSTLASAKGVFTEEVKRGESLLTQVLSKKSK